MDEIVYVLLIGAAAGWLAGQLIKGGGFGLIGNLIVGVLGGLLGGWLLPQLGIRASGLVGLLIQATIGAVILLFVLDFAFRKRRAK